MARYFFDLKDGERGYVDRVGVDLSNDDEARHHADLVAAELLKNRERKARHWHIDVHDGEHRKLFEVAFIGHDRTLGHLSPPLKNAIEELSRRRRALVEVMGKSRAVKRQAKALMAKSRGRLYIAADEGEEVLGSL